jgi:hypothetical protein
MFKEIARSVRKGDRNDLKGLMDISDSCLEGWTRIKWLKISNVHIKICR